MTSPIKPVNRQRMLWESASDEPPAVLSDEQQKELMNALMELLLSSAAKGFLEHSDGGNDGE